MLCMTLLRIKRLYIASHAIAVQASCIVFDTGEHYKTYNITKID